MAISETFWDKMDAHDFVWAMHDTKRNLFQLVWEVATLHVTNLT